MQLVCPAATLLDQRPLAGWQEKRFALPGKPDHAAAFKVCVQRSGKYLRAYISWKETDVADLALGQKRYDLFTLGTRLERYDGHIAWKNCNLLADMNEGFWDDGTCYTSWVYTTLTGGWTGDGTLSVDIDNDGKGGFVRELTGSPVLY
ncbi:hypothetical protein [Phytohabitans rumicis]|uniref:Uncharacterized protein n=1 Tax=Phytohabitans rumicis TaxID=1076125 RepID=A0A6V8KYS3_9ACTN|nr:hypothetical protein [Phytohabitans rumicis]GFJ90262.1 hypothetical protein Prum_039040 [Phytohabitans rumicis]